MKKRKAIIIFVKYPEKGKVKTRLALTTSNNFAVSIYNLIAGQLFKLVETLNNDVDMFVFYATNDDEVKIRNWVGKEYNYKAQNGNTLGDKMANAFEEIFASDYDSALIIGSDVPEITNDILLKSFTLLNSCDIVIAPSDDGGYSLLGMNKFNSKLFKNIEWSTINVLNETKKRINENKLKLKILDTLKDIDTFDELVDWVKTSTNKNMIENVKNIARKENIRL